MCKQMHKETIPFKHKTIDTVYSHLHAALMLTYICLNHLLICFIFIADHITFKGSV